VERTKKRSQGKEDVESLDYWIIETAIRLEMDNGDCANDRSFWSFIPGLESSRGPKRDPKRRKERT